METCVRAPSQTVFLERAGILNENSGSFRWAAPMKCFKAYDIRGRVPDELNEDIAYRLGRAFARTVDAGPVVVGFDIRRDSPALAAATLRGLNDEGRDAIDIGLCGTEEVYFQTFHRRVAGGVMVTASQHPIDYHRMQ